jgi:hypothetical protein
MKQVVLRSSATTELSFSRWLPVNRLRCARCVHPGDPKKSIDGKLEQPGLDVIEWTKAGQRSVTEKLISFVDMASGPALMSPVG